MDPDRFGHLASDPTLSVFEPERFDDEMTYAGLACECGARAFHLSGWPRVASGRGGFFWRSVTRVWREARLPMQDGEPAESPYWLPLFVRCDECDREQALLDDEGIAGSLPRERRAEPRESHRCRVCRRGSVALVVGQARDPQAPDRETLAADFEVVARCNRCNRQARVAWSEGRPSDQEIRLDLLYGRR